MIWWDKDEDWNAGEFPLVFGRKDTDVPFAQEPYLPDAKSCLSVLIHFLLKTAPTCPKEWNIVSTFWREALNCELNPEMDYWDR